ncbi:MAG TPA: helix-turn-helix domain-containing protein, partial [Candidatus Polarisedimenticolaceae bacterium]|nr:helix-turn-helix domain-containing protein [Candidatus Polarisedimenticolaceae bacterium]
KASREGGFREDLYFRLAVVSVRVPALRDRREDIPVLASHFLERFRKELGKEQLKLSESSLTALRTYAWPGNVRELENAIERAAILADGPLLEPQHLSLSPPHPAEDDLDAFARAVGLEGGLDAATERAREMVERLMIKRALAEAGGNKVRAAQRLDMNYKRLLARVRELGLEEDSLV